MAVIRYEADLLVSMLMTATDLGSFLAELARVRRGSLEQKKGFLLAFSRLVELPKKQFKDAAPSSQAQAVGLIRTIYQETTKETLSPKEKEHTVKQEEIKSRWQKLVHEQTIMQLLITESGISLAGPDPWKRAAAGLTSPSPWKQETAGLS